MNIAILFRISSRFQRWYRKLKPTLFHWNAAFFHDLATAFFPSGSINYITNSLRPFSIEIRHFSWFDGFFENISLLYIVKHIWLNIAPAFSVRWSVRPSEFAIHFSTIPRFRACFFLSYQSSIKEYFKIGLIHFSTSPRKLNRLKIKVFLTKSLYKYFICFYNIKYFVFLSDYLRQRLFECIKR